MSIGLLNRDNRIVVSQNGTSPLLIEIPLEKLPEGEYLLYAKTLDGPVVNQLVEGDLEMTLTGPPR